jgi:hypothetical protein
MLEEETSRLKEENSRLKERNKVLETLHSAAHTVRFTLPETVSGQTPVLNLGDTSPKPEGLAQQPSLSAQLQVPQQTAPQPPAQLSPSAQQQQAAPQPA